MWRKSEDAKSAPEPASESKSRSNSPAQSATPAPTSSPTAATVSRGVIIKGEISGQGDFFLDGTFEGKVHLPEGSFTAGPHAHVTAEIEAREIIVLGEIIGTLKARERVHISSTGRLTGDMDTRGIVIEDGAILHSKVATPRAALPKPTADKAAPPEATSTDSGTASEDASPKEGQTAQGSSSAKESPRTKGAAAAGDS
jgi:cytoskeletal protein CcmA (bactofilin family)